MLNRPEQQNPSIKQTRLQQMQEYCRSIANDLVAQFKLSQEKLAPIKDQIYKAINDAVNNLAKHIDNAGRITDKIFNNIIDQLKTNLSIIIASAKSTKQSSQSPSQMGAITLSAQSA